MVWPWNLFDSNLMSSEFDNTIDIFLRFFKYFSSKTFHVSNVELVPIFNTHESSAVIVKWLHASIEFDTRDKERCTTSSTFSSSVQFSLGHSAKFFLHFNVSKYEWRWYKNKSTVLSCFQESFFTNIILKWKLLLIIEQGHMQLKWHFGANFNIGK